MVSLEYIPLTKTLYPEWDTFCMNSDDVWFWHTTDWLDYTLVLRPELESRQMSFIVKNNAEILAICPLILNIIKEDGKNYRIFSFDRYHGIAPALKRGLSYKQKYKIYQQIFDHIDSLAREFDVHQCLMKLTPLMPSFYQSIPYNHLMRFGYLNTSLDTQIIDLSKELDQILSEMRESHRYDIRRGEKHFEIGVYDKDTITQEIFDQYRLLHHKAAGRVTRPLSTFTMMHDWIREGKAILCGASYQGKYLGFALVNIYKDGAFYSSSSDDPEENAPVPVSHCIQWGIITWLKGHNKFKRYEIGLQQWGNQLYDYPSEKDLSISQFKRGFGGMTVPVFSGEKYYSKDFFLKIMAQRVEKYWK